MPRQQPVKETSPSFEQCLERIQAVVERLENGNLPLEESLQLFAEGVQLVRCCQEHLTAAELRVETLLPGVGDKLIRKPFQLPEEER